MIVDLKALKKMAKDDILEKLDVEIRADSTLTLLIDKKDELFQSAVKMETYIDEQIELVGTKFDEYVKNFKLDKIKIEGDIIIAFSELANFENSMISMFMRNKKYYLEIEKWKDLANRITIKLLKKKGVLGAGAKSKKDYVIVDEDDLVAKLNELYKKFELFFKIYEEVSEKMKGRGYSLKTYIDFLKFSRGNE